MLSNFMAAEDLLEFQRQREVELERLQQDCWLYAKYCSERGYGTIQIDYKNYRVHRLMYENAKGAVPDGFVLDHLCEVTTCINPDHLEAVTQRENSIRGKIKTRKTHCKRGHLLTPNNVKENVRKNGYVDWLCYDCAKLRSKERYERTKGVKL